MHSRVSFRAAASVLLSCVLSCWAIDCRAAIKSHAAENLFANASFEDGRDLWQLDHAGKTTATFRVDDKDAAAGQRSAVLSVGAAEEWGIQFGQTMEAPAAGKTYTFAVLAKSTKRPATIRLEIERRGSPYDRAAASPPQTVTKETWTELHVTFKVTKSYPEGWFAYVSCTQAGAEFRLDMFRLYAGEYVPYAKAAQTAAASAAVSLFDTVSAAPGPLAGEAIAKRSGWTQVPEDNTDHKFTGDAVVANDRLAMVLRHGGPGAEIYCLGGERPTLRAVLTPAADKPAGKLGSIAVVSNGPGEVALDGVFSGSDGKPVGVRFELAMGQPFVKTEPREGTTGLWVEAPCRFIVLPDFFADDIVIDAADLSVARAELPSENFLLQLLPQRDAIVMTVASNRTQDARIELASQAAASGPQARLINRSQMFYGGGKIWVAVLQDANLWHTCNVTKEQSGKVLGLDWKAPFAAQWRVDWRLGQQAHRQLGNALRTPERPLHETRLVRQSQHPPARPQALDDRAGLVPVSLLDRSRRPRLAATVGPPGAFSRAGPDLSHQSPAGNAVGRIYRGRRGAGDPGRRSLRVHSRRGSAGHDHARPRHLLHARCPRGHLCRQAAEEEEA